VLAAQTRAQRGKGEVPWQRESRSLYEPLASRYANALMPVMSRPTISVCIVSVPS
jgi:hypothetical protein